MKKQLSYWLLRIAIVLVCVAAANLVYTNFFYEDELKRDGWLRLKVDSMTEEEILFMGASPNKAYDHNETDKQSITDHLSQRLSALDIAVFDTGAVHAAIFLDVLKHLPEEKLPKKLIVEMNLRSFGLQWIQSSLENSLQRNSAFLDNRFPLWTRLRIALKDYAWIPPGERNRIIQTGFRFDRIYPSGPERTVFHWVDRSWKKHPEWPMAGEYIKCFGFRLSKENERIKQFDELALFCKDKNIEVLFVILPENMDEVNSLCGTKLNSLMNENVAFLQKRYNRSGSHVLDLLDEVRDDQWFERNFVTEHYRSQGRQIVAQKLADKLKQLKWN